MLDLIDPKPDLCLTETIELSKRSPSTFEAIGSTNDPVLSCVFDKNCSELFKAIDQKQWVEVAYFIDNAEWPGLGMLTPDFPPLQQALTVVSGFEGDTDETWTYLPLHLAIVRGAPLSIIDRLISLAPKTATIPDQDGNLALHLSLWMNSRYEVQKYLIYTNKAAIVAPNTAGQTPVQFAMTATRKAPVRRAKIIDAFMEHANAPPKILKLKEIEFFCDYNTDCSPLFKRIAKEDWDSVNLFLTEGKWSRDTLLTSVLQFLALDTIDLDTFYPLEQVMTLVTRCDDNQKLMWARLPIHLALLLRAPLSVIRNLVNAFPESLAFPDNDGCLPLHRALQCSAHDNVVEFLVSQFPEAIRVRNAHKQSALSMVLGDPNSLHRGRVLRAFVLAAASEQQLLLQQPPTAIE